MMSNGNMRSASEGKKTVFATFAGCTHRELSAMTATEKVCKRQHCRFEQDTVSGQGRW